MVVGPVKRVTSLPQNPEPADVVTNPWPTTLPGVAV